MLQAGAATSKGRQGRYRADDRDHRQIALKCEILPAQAHNSDHFRTAAGTALPGKPERSKLRSVAGSYEECRLWHQGYRGSLNLEDHQNV